jgi:hypothetical protein
MQISHIYNSISFHSTSIPTLPPPVPTQYFTDSSRIYPNLISYLMTLAQAIMCEDFK